MIAVTNNPALFCPKAKVVHIDVESSNISKIIQADVPIVGPCKPVLQELLDGVRDQLNGIDSTAIDAWWQSITQWRSKQSLRYQQTKDSIAPQAAVEAVYQVTKGDAYITSDVGQHQMFAAQYYPFNAPNRWINSGGLGTMGFGLPAAMGVFFHDRDRPVVCITGEGSIQMCIQELSTCKQWQLPVKIINLNNGYLGMVKQWQDMQYARRRSQSYMESTPDFIKLAEAYGHKAIRVTQPDQLMPALEQTFGEWQDELVFVDIHVDPDQHVYPMHIATKGISDMWLTKDEQVS